MTENDLPGTIRYFPADTGTADLPAILIGTLWVLGSTETPRPWIHETFGAIHSRATEGMRGSIVVGAMPGTAAAELRGGAR